MKVFERPGPVNTDEVVGIVREVSIRYKYIVVASLSLDELRQAGQLKKGNILVLDAFGAGFTWGAAVYRW